MRNATPWTWILLAWLLLPLAAAAADPDWVEYPAKSGPGKGRHLVFLAGDEEYRSEEGLPMLARILSQRHGFRCTVLFSVNPDGTINPDRQESLSNPGALDSADAIVMLLRFRKYPPEVMRHFVEAFHRGVPIIALRTSTHAFQLPPSHPYREFSQFGERVLGEEWVTHWGRHAVEATRGVMEPSAKGHPILRGVEDIFGDTDVYEAYPPADATLLVRGQVLQGMKPGDPPARYTKRRASDRQEQDVNDPMMPVAWTREYKNEAGKTNRIFCTTMGSATDLASEGLRRLVVNAVYWGLKMEVPNRANVELVGPFQPTPYGFGTYKKGVRPADHALKPAGAPEASGPRLQLRPGDHIALLGNALADRMQHSGYFEALLHAAHPRHELVVRNLAAAGDEVSLWFRSENFGSRDEWLSKVKADVILAFYGFNESFKGPEGLDKFRADLLQFIRHTRSRNYSGRGSPRLALFSPVAQERHQDPNFPDPSGVNQQIALYAAAMREVAAAEGVIFVNLYEPSQKLYADAAAKRQSLTVNGHYLTAEGDRLLAPFLFQGLLASRPPGGNLEKLRLAVNEKNWQWHQRYRTVDGYNVYGGRSALAYQPEKPGFITDRTPPEPYISNYRVMQEEMSQRDVLTANRDKRVWALAQGKDLKVDDSNLPPVTPVPSNKPGPNPDGTHRFLSGEEAIGKMTVHSGMKVNLFADEKQFPELVQPVQMAWDTRGRLWVAVWPNYPERTPTSTRGDSLVILEDTDRDGRADKLTTFIDDLNAPTGFQFYKDGVLLMQAPDLWFVRDTNGDGRADWRERVLMGMDSADSHHTANAICHDPGGAIYLSDGVFHRTQVETAWGPVRNVDAAIYRFEPRTGRFETYIAYGFANPHGRVFDRWGNDLVTDATGNNTYFGPAFSGWLDFEKGKHPGMNQFWERPSRPCAATAILSSQHFPEEFQGNFLNCNVISFQGVYRVKVSEQGSGLRGQTMEHLVHSSDPNFRPVAVNVGADGAIYIADWHNPIIGHMQHHLRDPNRDKQHGRIYRVTHEGRPLNKPQRIHGQPIPALVELLKHPEDGVRELAKVELGRHDSRKVTAAVMEWVRKLDSGHPHYEHQMMEALWVHQWHNVLNVPLLKRMLASSEPRARAAAGRVLCYWRDRVPESLAMFRALAEDEHPRVRLEAVRAASFYREAQAADLALAALKRPTDYYLDYCLNETLRQLEPWWRKAIQEGVPLSSDNPAALERLVDRLSTGELQKLPRTPGILAALVSRKDTPDQLRLSSLNALATERKSSTASETLSAMARLDRRDPSSAERLASLLPLLPGAELKSTRERLLELARSGRTSLIRQSAWAALALGDEGFDRLWTEAEKSPSALADLLAGIPLINDADLRNRAYDRARHLAQQSPSPESREHQAPSGRYLRVELPRPGPLTLAEVQVFSRGRDVAPAGRARQSSTDHGGEAGRAIDGNTDGAYASGTQTHTRENDRSPWWEVDLGSEQPIESIVIWNRTENNGAYAGRLDQFRVVVLNGARQEVFRKESLPAPAESARIEVGATDPALAVRRAAILALVSMQRDQPATFQFLSRLINQGDEVVWAARGVRTLPRDVWNAAEASSMAPALVAWAKNIPVSQRTSEDYVETIQVAGDLAGLLPAEKAADLQRELKSLRVPVFVIRTVREQMRFDTTRIVVEPGKALELIIENHDFMPHNLVVVKPGTRERIGTAADAMPFDALDDQGRPYVPKSPDVLAATALLESGQRALLKWTAPRQEGVYEFVCTYPNHWQAMWGQIVVTSDVEGYLQKHPKPPVPPPHAHHAQAH